MKKVMRGGKGARKVREEEWKARGGGGRKKYKVGLGKFFKVGRVRDITCMKSLLPVFLLLLLQLTGVFRVR